MSGHVTKRCFVCENALICVSFTLLQGDYPETTVLANATNSYNRHGYAWSMREGEATCWLEDSQLHWYVDDQSFVSVTTADSADLIYYENAHSVVKSLVESGKHESKWGRGPLMRHSPRYGFLGYYTGRVVHYYRSTSSPTISGPSQLCSGSSGTVTVANVPSGYTWTCSSYLTPGSASGNSKTFTGNSNGNIGWVAVNKGSTEQARKEV
jgi:hypothetical protein